MITQEGALYKNRMGGDCSAAQERVIKNSQRYLKFCNKVKPVCVIWFSNAIIMAQGVSLHLVP